MRPGCSPVTTFSLLYVYLIGTDEKSMTETAEQAPEAPSVAASFAQLMGQAKQAVEESSTEEAPYGYTTDPDGTVRAKKTAGRPRRTQKSLEELKAEKAEQAPADGQAPPDTRVGDRAPSESRSRFRSSKAKPDEPKSYPQFREGVIEKGINRLYRKAGKIVKVWDASVGQALIDITRAEEPDDITVGKAWEEVARTNPRIRKFLLRIIKGGNWGALAWAHAPVLLALFIKYRLGERLPLGNFMEAFMTPDGEDGAPSDGSPLDGLLPQDMSQMGGLMDMAMQMAQQMSGQRAPAGTGRAPQPPVVPGEVVTDPFGQAVAAKAAANGQPPPKIIRNQPRRPAARAKRG